MAGRTQFSVTMHEVGVDLDNDDRARMVEPLLWVFAEAYYPGDLAYMREHGLLFEYVVSDFICDLMHMCDHIPVMSGCEPDEIGIVSYGVQAARAQFNYDEELEDERIHDDPEEGPT